MPSAARLKPVGVARHRTALRTSSFLTQVYRRMYRPEATMIPPEEIIRVLNRAGVKFVLMGTHGVGGWRSESRATNDVDFLIQPKDHRKAMKAVQEAFPQLQAKDTPVVTRYSDTVTGEVAIDLMKPTAKILKAVFKHSVPVGKTHRVPDLEMALVSKFAAMVSPNRSIDKKYIDAGDFINIVRHNQPKIDVLKLGRLADMVYAGGGSEIVEHLENAKAGRRLSF